LFLTLLSCLDVQLQQKIQALTQQKQATTTTQQTFTPNPISTSVSTLTPATTTPTSTTSTLTPISSSTPPTTQAQISTTTPFSATIQTTFDPETLLGTTNRLSPEEKTIILQFLSGNKGSILFTPLSLLILLFLLLILILSFVFSFYCSSTLHHFLSWRESYTASHAKHTHTHIINIH
jgi:ABC-type Na+ efflux pump permease subunit